MRQWRQEGYGIGITKYSLDSRLVRAFSNDPRGGWGVQPLAIKRILAFKRSFGAPGDDLCSASSSDSAATAAGGVSHVAPLAPYTLHTILCV